MKEEIGCEFEDRCKEVYPGEAMDKHREQCDFINCSLCDRYWNFYDQRVMRKMRLQERRAEPK